MLNCLVAVHTNCKPTDAVQIMIKLTSMRSLFVASLQVASLFYMTPSVSRNFKANLNHNDGVLESISCLFCLFFFDVYKLIWHWTLCLCRNEDVNKDLDVNVISCQQSCWAWELSNVNKLSISTFNHNIIEKLTFFFSLCLSKTLNAN